MTTRHAGGTLPACLVAIGVWRSLVAQCVWDAKVRGSNPFTPTKISRYVAYLGRSKQRMKKESQGKYLFVIAHGHPMADSRGRVLEHRYVMAEHLGRMLTTDEIVHHLDENTRNNDISNLALMLRGEHTNHHCPAFRVDLVCPYCARPFVRVRRCMNGVRTFYSRSCSTSYYHALPRPPKERPQRPPKARPHGVYGTYRKGCRCAPCTEANTLRIKESRLRRDIRLREALP